MSGKGQKQRNAVLGITGFLIFGEGIFLQILEGPKDAVTALLATIGRDQRHRDMKVFYEAEETERAFDNWRMTYISPDPTELACWTGLRDMTTLVELREEVERQPDRVPGILVAIVEALSMT
jgi:hypothetical protein